MPSAHRPGRMRSRRGRGMRGPLALPGPLTPEGVPVARSPRAVFDAIVLASIERLRPRLGHELDGVEFGVEDVPLLPVGWDGDAVPLASVTRTDTPTPRIVLFRLPISQHAGDKRELDGLVFSVLVEQLADLWNRDVDDIDPR